MSIFTLVYIAQIVFMAMTYQRMGLEWYVAIIPFYNYLKLGERLNRKDLGKNLCIAQAVAAGCMVLATVLMGSMVASIGYMIVYGADVSDLLSGKTLIAIVALIAAMIAAVMSAVYSYKLYKEMAAFFGKEPIYAIILLCIPVVGFGVLAFESKGKSNNQGYTGGLHEGQYYPNDNGYNDYNRNSNSNSNGYSDYNRNSNSNGYNDYNRNSNSNGYNDYNRNSNSNGYNSGSSNGYNSGSSNGYNSNSSSSNYNSNSSRSASNSNGYSSNNSSNYNNNSSSYGYNNSSNGYNNSGNGYNNGRY
jgi:hypothetical protein